jgi:hypothetical protein
VGQWAGQAFGADERHIGGAYRLAQRRAHTKTRFNGEFAYLFRMTLQVFAEAGDQFARQYPVPQADRHSLFDLPAHEFVGLACVLLPELFGG